MELFDASTLDVQPHQPEVLQTEDEGRTLAINLPAGESLQEHETRERAWLFVASGRVSLSGTGAGPGTVAVFDPHERREVVANEDSILILVLAPWPAQPEESHRG